MTDNKRNKLNVVDNGDEPLCNHSDNATFASILEARMGRRDLLKGTLGAAMVGLFGTGLVACGSSSSSNNGGGGGGGGGQPTLGFTTVPLSESDDIVVPEGYRYHVLMPWGQPITGSYPAFSLSNSGADQGQQVGMHHDGMHFFPIEGEDPYEGSSEDGLLVMNHEYIEPRFMHVEAIGQPFNRGHYPTKGDGTRAADQVLKEMNAHGISVARIRKGTNNEWSVQPDVRNRRITALTEMEIHGPVRGSGLVRTKYSPNGTRVRGTLNNCAHGVTPWNTYVMAEENWAGYFVNHDDTLPREHTRYGVRSSGTGRYAWELADNGADEYIRFDASSTGATRRKTIGTSRTVSAGWSSSTRSIRTACRRSVPRSVASRTKALFFTKVEKASRSFVTPATMLSSNTSTSS
nr:alkaline phosphatase PhoX [Alkalilimnicola ehrlichii]